MSSSINSQLDKELSKRLWGSLSALVLGATLFLWPLWGFKTNINASQQKAKAESLAYQVLEIRKKAVSAKRGPASVNEFQGEGLVGQGSNGGPYHYRVFEEGDSWVVSVWSSSAPNEPTEVRIHKDQLEHRQERLELRR
jgi:hypothetical protein